MTLLKEFGIKTFANDEQKHISMQAEEKILCTS